MSSERFNPSVRSHAIAADKLRHIGDKMLPPSLQNTIHTWLPLFHALSPFLYAVLSFG